MSFRLFRSSQFSVYKSFTSASVFKFIPKRMGFFKISCLDSSLLVYRNTIDFCRFIFYPVNLLNSFVSPKNIFVDSSNFLHRQSCDMQIGTVLFFLSDLYKFYFLTLLHGWNFQHYGE